MEKKTASHVESAARAARMENDIEALKACEASPTPASLYIAGVLSDVQEMILRGQKGDALELLAQAKFLIFSKLSVQDSKGRIIG